MVVPLVVRPVLVHLGAAWAVLEASLVVLEVSLVVLEVSLLVESEVFAQGAGLVV